MNKGPIFIGFYHVTSMEMWDHEFVDANGPGYIDFGIDGFDEMDPVSRIDGMNRFHDSEFTAVGA